MQHIRLTRLFVLISYEAVARVVGRKALGLSESIYEADGSLVRNQQRRLERWAEYFEAQFSWPPAPASHSYSGTRPMVRPIF
ncbi:unnamed protein product [Echinostoma caproni]|uniref:Transposase n=1 Tax=Echinostoma caproni TaxID=27848 RepID=A0A183BE82_9TREM|nr:unnamed protein product [Echinostoma caproni]